MQSPRHEHEVAEERRNVEVINNSRFGKGHLCIIKSTELKQTDII